MSSTVTLDLGASTTITMDLANLGSSTTFIAGRESNQIDNTSNNYVDALVSGTFTVGTTPTLPCQLNIYLYGWYVSLATTPIDVLDGTDSAETLTNTTVLTNSIVLARFCPVLVNTSDTTYPVYAFSVAGYFNGVMPDFWGLFVSHNMTAALRNNAVNTNSFQYQGSKFLIT